MEVIEVEPMSQCHRRHSNAKLLRTSCSERGESVSSCVNQNVTSGGKHNFSLSRLETLVTRLPGVNVTDFTLEGDTCDVCDTDKDVLKFVDCELVYQWFVIALEEGHIEPSQPQVGRIVGWPIREFNFSSLWNDYLCWNIKNGFTPDQFREKKQFHALCRYFFEVNVHDRITFPPLNHCRNKFNQGRKMNVSS